MKAAAAGRIKRRAPITVRRLGESAYLVLDGNATYGVALKSHWRSMPVLVRSGDG